MKGAVNMDNDELEIKIAEILHTIEDWSTEDKEALVGAIEDEIDEEEESTWD